MKARIPLPLRLALAWALIVPSLAGQEDTLVPNLGAGPRCGSSTIARTFTPGAFQEALDLARAESRMLLVKGVAFGMDELGASAPTKGHW